MNEIKEWIRVRFAPSPTGELHIGGARTALFNWLFARHHRGKFILRIEDTDVERSSEHFVRSLIKDLRWLGLDWDEGPDVGGDYGPYFQSQRGEIYKYYALKLLKEGKAYFCYCTPEELEEEKRRMQREGKPPKYSGRCRNLTPRQRRMFESEGREPTIRFKVPEEGVTCVKDLIRGEVRFENRLLGDFILLKSNGMPTFNFANVIDDSLMGINYVIRGDDHLSNTPRQILLYQALNFKVPKYAHLPMILGSDGTKLSKRHGATSISYYREKGYLPWALVNYLALLGWSTPDSQQLFEREELIQKFSLERVGKSSAIFDPKKLEWMNGEYIRRSKPEQLVELLLPYLEKAGLIGKRIDPSTREKIIRVVELEQDRLKVLSEFVDLADFFFKRNFTYDSQAVTKILKRQYVPSLLGEMRKRIERMSSFDAESLEKMARSLSEELSLSTSKVFHPLRVALTGKMKGPGLFELAEVLGKEETLRRIDRTLKKLKTEYV